MNKKNAIEAENNFILVLSAEPGLITACEKLNDRFDIAFEPLEESVFKKIQVSSLSADTENLMSIEAWMPYINNKLSDHNKRHIVEISEVIKPSDLFFVIQMAFYLEADGLYVNEGYAKKVVSLLSENTDLFVKSAPDPLFQSNADVFRSQIDVVDNEILQLLKRRNDLVNYLASLKNQYNLPMLQTERWNMLIEKRIKKGTQLNLEDGHIRELFGLLHKFAIEIHMKRYFRK